MGDAIDLATPAFLPVPVDLTAITDYGTNEYATGFFDLNRDVAFANGWREVARKQASFEHGMTKEEKKVTCVLQQKAEQGDVEAMESVAHGLLFGVEGFSVNVGMAFFWLDRACEAGSTSAMEVSGIALLDGSLGRKDASKGMDRLRTAAGKGSYLATYHLGCVLADGSHDVGVDLGEARQWLEKTHRLPQSMDQRLDLPRRQK